VVTVVVEEQPTASPIRAPRSGDVFPKVCKASSPGRMGNGPAALLAPAVLAAMCMPGAGCIDGARFAGTGEVRGKELSPGGAARHSLVSFGCPAGECPKPHDAWLERCRAPTHSILA